MHICSWSHHGLDDSSNECKGHGFDEELEVEIYMDQLERFVRKGKKHLVWKFKKIVYNLKQSPRAWYHRIDSFFINRSFSRSQIKHSLYTQQSGEFLSGVILYVDDLIIWQVTLPSWSGSSWSLKTNLKYVISEDCTIVLEWNLREKLEPVPWPWTKGDILRRFSSVSTWRNVN